MAKNLIEESRRYVDNARTVLRDKAKLDVESNRYEDEKYVRSAGHYLWHAILLALDAVFKVRDDRRTRVNIDDYLKAIGKRDRKLLAWVNSGYNIAHLYMGYDGELSKGVSDDGIRVVNDIINRCEGMVAVSKKKD